MNDNNQEVNLQIAADKNIKQNTNMAEMDINKLFDFSSNHIKYFINVIILKCFMLNLDFETVLKKELEKYINAKHKKFPVILRKIINTYQEPRNNFYQLSDYQDNISLYYNETALPMPTFINIANIIGKYSKLSQYDAIKSIVKDMGIDINLFLRAQKHPTEYFIKRVELDKNLSYEQQEKYYNYIKLKQRLSSGAPILQFLINPTEYTNATDLVNSNKAKMEEMIKPNVIFTIVNEDNKEQIRH